MEQYGGLAGIYDSMIDTDYDKWIEFIKKYSLKKDIKFSGMKVLELGCGTGNMTLRLKKLGLDVTALDISEDMLSVASSKASDAGSRIMFIKQNMENFNTGKKYDMIFSFCDGYNYIVDEKGLKKSFSRVYDHLKKEGVFIFDISTAYKLKQVIGSNTFTLNEDEKCYIWDNYLENDIIEMYISFFIKQGDLYRRIDEKHIQKAYETEYVEKRLEASGFKNICIYNDYSFEKADERSLRATFLCYREE